MAFDTRSKDGIETNHMTGKILHLKSLDLSGGEKKCYHLSSLPNPPSQLKKKKSHLKSKSFLDLCVHLL